MDSNFKPGNTGVGVPVLFVIGPPRSGTSILGRVLDCHPNLSTWVEPYYVWDYHFRSRPHDELTADDATPEVRDRIVKEFSVFRRAFGGNRVVDKSPRNCLRIPFIEKVFPDSNYLFIVRDGRDAVSSIKQQWQLKQRIIHGRHLKKDWEAKSNLIRKWLKKRPLWRMRIQSLLFEVGPPRYWRSGTHLHRLRWAGNFGWGPRFKGWQRCMDSVSLAEFCALQWSACAAGIMENRSRIPDSRQYVITYEDFVKDHKDCLRRALSHFHLGAPEVFWEKLPEINRQNTGKWKKQLTPDEIASITPLMEKAMLALQYRVETS